MKYLDVLYAQLLAISGLVLACVFTPTSQAASISDLLITEIMANPAAVSDANGEWLELFNPTQTSIDLNGIVLSDSTSTGHTITSSNSLLINPGDYFVLARSGDSSSNGGVTADYVYSSFLLGNSIDQIIFTDDSGAKLQLDYNTGFVPSGASMELIDAVMLPGNYAASLSAFGAGDLGTPGTAGSFVHQVSASPVPLPSAIWLMGSGLLGLTGLSRRRRHRQTA